MNNSRPGPYINPHEYKVVIRPVDGLMHFPNEGGLPYAIPRRMRKAESG